MADDTDRDGLVDPTMEVFKSDRATQSNVMGVICLPEVVEVGLPRRTKRRVPVVHGNTK